MVVLVVDNGMYGTIRMHQERQYPGRVSGTDLLNPDFVALARVVRLPRRARRADRRRRRPRSTGRSARGAPAVLHLAVDPEALTPRQTLSEIRAAASGSERERSAPKRRSSISLSEQGFSSSLS